MKKQIFSIDFGTHSIKTHFDGKDKTFLSMIAPKSSFPEGTVFSDDLFILTLLETGERFVVGGSDEEISIELNYDKEVFQKYLSSIIYRLMKLHGVNFSEPILCMYGMSPSISELEEHETLKAINTIKDGLDTLDFTVLSVAVGQGVNFDTEEDGYGKLLIIDVGHTSTHTMSFDGRNPLRGLNVHREIGGSYVLNRIVENMEGFCNDYSETRNEKFFFSDAIQCIEKGGRKMPNGDFVVGGWLHEAQNDFTRMIFENNLEILEEAVLASDAIIVVGGGARHLDAEVLGNGMLSSESRSKIINALYPSGDDALYSNVRGFSKAGVLVLEDEIKDTV